MARGRGKLTPQDYEYMKTISNNINKYLQRENYKQVDLVRATGIPASTLTGYVKGTSLPIPGNVQKIADFFGVLKSDIDPRFKSAASQNTDSDSVSKLSQELNKENHTKWVNYGNNLLDKQNRTVSEGKVAYMSDYRETIQKPAPGKVSAGTGYWQEDDYNTMVSFYIDEIPEDDEYDTIAITVGNSMAPKIKNGDFLFIKLTNQIDLNTIGIFQINGENFVKKLRDGYLESLNPDFDDIELSESDDIRIIGEVVSIYRDK